MARDDADALRGVPPEDFARERNALAKRLAAAGRAEEAAEIRRLRRPSLPLWAVNQAARGDRQAVDRLVDAVERLRRAHFGPGDDAARARARQRDALRALVERAGSVIAGAGRSTTADVLARVSATLLGAAADPEARRDLERGRLSEELSAPGFEALAGVAPAPARRPGKDDRAGPAARERRRREAARAAAGEARARAERLERDAERHRREADEASAAAKDLERRLREQRERARAARAAAERSARAAARARRDPPT